MADPRVDDESGDGRIATGQFLAVEHVGELALGVVHEGAEKPIVLFSVQQ